MATSCTSRGGKVSEVSRSTCTFAQPAATPQSSKPIVSTTDLGQRTGSLPPTPSRFYQLAGATWEKTRWPRFHSSPADDYAPWAHWYKCQAKLTCDCGIIASSGLRRKGFNANHSTVKGAHHAVRDCRTGECSRH